MSQSEPPENLPYRIALVLEYDGGSFCGWQKQLKPVQNTVQQELETALSKVADHRVQVNCAGRTDAGVHATCQVVHFDCAIDRGSKAWVIGVNSLLPKTIRVLWSKLVTSDFHARFSATARRYNYVIQQRETAPAILSQRVTHIRYDLDVAAMNRGAQALLGEQDFTSFRAASCQSKTAMRNVHAVTVRRQGAFIVIDIEANAFLQHMVRNIAGSLLEIGRGAQADSWIEQLLPQKDRSLAAVTAAPDGLYLTAVLYPEEFAIASSYTAPIFLNALT